MKELKRSRDFDRLMVESVQNGYSFYAWNSLGGVIEKCGMKIKAYRKDFKEMELQIIEGEENKLEKVVSGNKLINVYVPEISITFSTELKMISEDKRIKIVIPSDFTFYERRKSERVSPEKTCFVNFEFNKQMFRKAIFDISLGGIAIILPKSDKLNLTKGTKFDHFVLDVALKKIIVKAECVNTTVIDRFKNDNLPYGGYKLAFRFTEISEKDKLFLKDYIDLEMLALEKKKKAN